MQVFSSKHWCDLVMSWSCFGALEIVKLLLTDHSRSRRFMFKSLCCSSRCFSNWISTCSLASCSLTHTSYHTAHLVNEPCVSQHRYIQVQVLCVLSNLRKLDPRKPSDNANSTVAAKWSSLRLQSKRDTLCLCRTTKNASSERTRIVPCTQSSLSDRSFDVADRYMWNILLSSL